VGIVKNLEEKVLQLEEINQNDRQGATEALAIAEVKQG